jgi:hypothetical protein
MANGFLPGTWNQLPSNCTQTFVLTYIRCAEYGLDAVLVCVSSVTKYETECVQWAWQTVKKCSSWAWLFCVIFAIVVTAVCLVVATVAITVCALFTVVVLIVCILWTLVTFVFCLSSANGGTAFLLTDGTVMMQEFKSVQYLVGVFTFATNRWWKLTPDQFGSYANGSWRRLADSHFARAYFASAVLADGRVIVCGGEYSDGSGSYQQDDNNSCEVYDPVANTWTMFASPTSGSPPQVWSLIGDATGALLPDGTFLMGSIENGNVANLDPVTLTWTDMKSRPGVNSSNEDSWVLMPDNTIAAPSCQNSPTTWVYHIAANQWKGTNLAIPVVDTETKEIGPGLLRYDGTAFFLGAIEHTAIYSPTASPNWSNGPDLPDQAVGTAPLKIGIQDGPAALLVNGNILFAAGVKEPQEFTSNKWSTPCWFFEFDGTTFNRTSDPPNNVTYTFATRLLLLPNGDVLFCREDDNSFYAYHSDAATPQDSFRPVIQTCPSNLTQATTIQISGLQFNGLSQAVGYGDDSQAATNYPLVRIVNKQSSHVKYCRTFNHSSMGVATGAAVITTNVDIPPDIETGDSSLFVVANGIPSQPFDVTISGGLF